MGTSVHVAVFVFTGHKGCSRSKVSLSRAFEEFYDEHEFGEHSLLDKKAELASRQGMIRLRFRQMDIGAMEIQWGIGFSKLGMD